MINGYLSEQATLHFCRPNDCLSNQNVNNAVTGRERFNLKYKTALSSVIALDIVH